MAGRERSTTPSTNVSTSSCNELSSLPATGTLDKVSAVYKCLPGTWHTV